MDVTMIAMCAFDGASMKLGMTPGGGGPDGVVVGSIKVKFMDADIANSYVLCAWRKTRRGKIEKVLWFS